MTELVIRQAHAGDVDAISEIERLCFPDPWSRAAILAEFTDNPRTFYLAAEIGTGDRAELVGYMGLWQIGDEGHITNVAVKPDVRGRRIGGQLLETMLERADRLGIRHYTLEVRAGNTAARALYEKYGFAVEGVRKGYYQVGHEDALIMWRHAPTEATEEAALEAADEAVQPPEGGPGRRFSEAEQRSRHEG